MYGHVMSVHIPVGPGFSSLFLLFIYLFIFKNFIIIIVFFERESRGGAEKEGEKESQEAGSPLLAQSPTRGLIPQTMITQPESESVWMLYQLNHAG